MQAVVPAIFRREIQCLRLPQWGSVESGLNSGVEGIQASSCGEPQRILLVQLVDWRLKLYRTERRPRSDQGIVPEPAVQKHFARMRFVVTRPLDTAKLLQTGVAHAAMHRAQAAHLVPDGFGMRLSPIMPKPARQIVDDLSIVAHPRRW